MLAQADRLDVPTFILEKEAHLMAKWAAKLPSRARSKHRAASLGFTTFEVQKQVEDDKHFLLLFHDFTEKHISNSSQERKTRCAVEIHEIAAMTG